MLGEQRQVALKEQHLELRQYLDILKRKTVFVSVFKKNPRRWLSSEAVTIAARRPSSPLHWHHTVDICYYSKSTCAFEIYFILRGKTFLKHIFILWDKIIQGFRTVSSKLLPDPPVTAVGKRHFRHQAREVAGGRLFPMAARLLHRASREGGGP